MLKVVNVLFGWGVGFFKALVLMLVAGWFIEDISYTLALGLVFAFATLNFSLNAKDLKDIEETTTEKQLVARLVSLMVLATGLLFMFLVSLFI